MDLRNNLANMTHKSPVFNANTAIVASSNGMKAVKRALSKIEKENQPYLSKDMTSFYKSKASSGETGKITTQVQLGSEALIILTGDSRKKAVNVGLDRIPNKELTEKIDIILTITKRNFKRKIAKLKSLIETDR